MNNNLRLFIHKNKVECYSDANPIPTRITRIMLIPQHIFHHIESKSKVTVSMIHAHMEKINTATPTIPKNIPASAGSSRDKIPETDPPAMYGDCPAIDAPIANMTKPMHVPKKHNSAPLLKF